ncbi:unnamed protein product [Pedinophyceae sp. YPF-701]|nr:unnamed protein product [Pedinophyceae sp. YPF-701]
MWLEKENKRPGEALGDMAAPYKRQRAALCVPAQQQQTRRAEAGAGCLAPGNDVNDVEMRACAPILREPTSSNWPCTSNVHGWLVGRVSLTPETIAAIVRLSEIWGLTVIGRGVKLRGVQLRGAPPGMFQGPGFCVDLYCDAGNAVPLVRSGLPAASVVAQ